MPPATGGTAGAPEASSPSSIEGAGAGRPFEVGTPAPVEPVQAPTALSRLRAGELDLDGYVDAKVREATAHLGTLPPARLDAIRAALRDRLASDPTLVELTRTATGQSPPALSDD